jgi:valyl-tRNA synthetase
MIAPWPEARADREDEAAERDMRGIMELITTVRMLRSEYDIPLTREVEVVLSNEEASFRGVVDREGELVKRLAKATIVDRSAEGDLSGAGANAVLRSGAELVIPLEGLIDVEREVARLKAEMDRVSGLLQGTEKRLANEQFTSKAPADVVEREREKADSFRDQRERLSRKLAALT